MTTGHVVIEHSTNGTAAPRQRVTPLLAVCSVCGGAAASTLSYLIARHAIARVQGHVLVCENAPLVLMPDACDIDRAQLSLQAILGVLER